MINQTCVDVVFGEMTYHHRWHKKDVITLFEKEWEITVAAKAYSGKPISENQRQSYQLFCNNKEQILSDIMSTVSKYIEEYVSENKFTEGDKEALMTAEIVTPRTLLFKQNGEAILLCDFKWDEHGLGIDINTLQIGSQDIFL